MVVIYSRIFQEELLNFKNRLMYMFSEHCTSMEHRKGNHQHDEKTTYQMDPRKDNQMTIRIKIGYVMKGSTIWVILVFN